MYHNQNSFQSPQKVLMSLHNHLFSVPIVRMSYDRISQINSCVWFLLEVSIMSVTFTHAVGYISCLRFYNAEEYFIAWIDHNLFTHSPMVGHLGCFLLFFQFSAIMNNAPLNHAQVFV